MKKMKWSLSVMLCSWVELLSVLGMIWVGASWINTVWTNGYDDGREAADWNALKIMLDIHNSMGQIEA